MRWTQSFIRTLREDPRDAEVASHRLMVRAGVIRKLAAGTYSYLPFGLRALQRVQAIIREEMARIGGQELLLPALQPRELWEKSGRAELMGEVLMQFKDRHGKPVVLGPTHEEVVTDLIAREVRSYRDLPLLVYQIQTKFRDEPRPRFGVIRSCEFLMKDAYSFHASAEDLDRTYQAVYDAYCRIFDRCGLSYLPVEADTGVMGGRASHEFMVFSDSGEDWVAACEACRYAATRDQAACRAPVDGGAGGVAAPLRKVPTPGATKVEAVSRLLQVAPSRLIKTLLYRAGDRVVAALVRGDHEVNEAKLARAAGSKGLRLATAEEVQAVSGGPVGFTGPVALRAATVVSDLAVAAMVNAVAGANEPDAHLLNVNPGRDFTPAVTADIRSAVPGDPCPRCAKPVILRQAIEIGHIFKLGTRYAAAFKATYLNEKGVAQELVMGCYGIGVTRVLATILEQHHDEAGIIWPRAVSPYDVLILPLDVRDPQVLDAAVACDQALQEAGWETLLDDREERAGVKFADAELLGIPLRVVVGPRTLARGEVELGIREGRHVLAVPRSTLVEAVKKALDRVPTPQ